jgi:hypothetical protein
MLPRSLLLLAGACHAAQVHLSPWYATEAAPTLRPAQANALISHHLHLAHDGLDTVTDLLRGFDPFSPAQDCLLVLVEAPDDRVQGESSHSAGL